MATSTYVALATTTLSSAASSVTFSSLPSYRDYIVVVNGTASATDNVYIEANLDATSNYPAVSMYGDSGGAGSGTGTNTGFNAGRFQTSPSMLICQIMDAGASDKHTTALARYGSPTTFVTAAASRWQNTAVITSLKVKHSGTFSSGTTFSLFGIEA